MKIVVPEEMRSFHNCIYFWFR